MTDPARALEVALDAGRQAARVHRQYLGTVASEEWSEKGIADFVTHVDREAEARILEIITRHFPDHAILAEESAGTSTAAPDADWLWIVDPLDGTTNYLHGYPMYSVSVALVQRGTPFAGAVVCAATGEEWTAVRGGGAFLNGRRIHVSETKRFERALVGTGFPFKLRGMLDVYVRQFRAISEHVSDIRRAGSAALDLCHLATGYFDAFWELDIRPWDYAAGTLMIREAGGIVNGLFDAGTHVGDPDWQTGGGIIAGNPHVYPMLQELLLSLRTDA